MYQDREYCLLVIIQSDFMITFKKVTLCYISSDKHNYNFHYILQ